jgi:hypothetical protein
MMRSMRQPSGVVGLKAAGSKSLRAVTEVTDALEELKEITLGLHPGRRAGGADFGHGSGLAGLKDRIGR